MGVTAGGGDGGGTAGGGDAEGTAGGGDAGGTIGGGDAGGTAGGGDAGAIVAFPGSYPFPGVGMYAAKACRFMLKWMPILE